jgi:hypothetical protein
MRTTTITLCALAWLLPATTWASPPPVGPGLHYPEWLEKNGRGDDAEPSEFKLINYFFTRVTATNQLGDPAGLKGVSLGPIGIGQDVGSGTKVGPNTTAFYVEQRWIPVLSYSPNFVDGLATFRAQFEVDYQWGQAANQIQNNQGGGFNADQVNIQTKNVNVGLYPTKNPYKLAIFVGTQSVYDSPYDPTITSLTDITRTGYKLTFFGSDATGRVGLFATRRHLEGFDPALGFGPARQGGRQRRPLLLRVARHLGLRLPDPARHGGGPVLLAPPR